MRLVIRAVMIYILLTQFVNAQTCTSNFGGDPIVTGATGMDDIGSGLDGALVFVGSNGVGFIGTGSHWAGKSLPGFPADGTLGRIAVGPDGRLLVAASDNHIWTITPGAGSWTEMTGLAKDVAITSDGTIWVIGTQTTTGGFHIYYWNGSTWVSPPGAGTRITGGPDNQPWVVNDSGNIYHRNIDGSWTQWPGLAQDIAVDSNDTPWVIGFGSGPGANVFVWHWNNGQWVCDPNAALGSNKQNNQNASITGGPGPSAFYIDAAFPTEVRNPVQH